MTKLVLFVLDRFGWLFGLLGADYPQLRAIIETKLILDGRRQIVGMQNTRTRKQPKNGFLSALAFYSFMGLFVGMISIQTKSPLLGMTVTFSFVMIMVALSLIADFSSVLLDTTDNAVLQPRPVNDRTILLARATHIVVYLGLLGLSLSLVSLVVGALAIHPLMPLIYLLSLACAIAFVVAMVSAFYLAALRFLNREKVRDVILYFQIFMTVGIFAAYQILPRMVDMSDLRAARIDDRWWLYVFPPAWMAAPIDMLNGQMDVKHLVLTVLAVLVPAFSVWLLVRVLSPRFARALAALEAAPTGGRLPASHGRSPGPLSRLVKRCTRGSATYAAFEFVRLLMSRDRNFKLRTYPGMAFAMLIPLALLLSDREGLVHAIRQLPASNSHLFMLYLATMMMPTALFQLRYSDRFQAAWVYEALPIARPGEILAGAFLAVIVGYVLPAFGLVALVLLTLWGPRIVPDVLLALSATLFVAGVQGVALGRRFPFSHSPNVVESSGRLGKNILLLLLPAALGGLHYLIRSNTPLVLGLIPLMFAAALLTIWGYARTTWAEVSRSATG